MKFCFKINNLYICDMRIISIQKLKEYWETHKDAEITLREWYAKVEKAQWKSFGDIKRGFNSVDYVGDQKYVFNIRGNRHRLIVAIKFTPALVYIRFVGTHSEYDKVNIKAI